jgi:hypothetical protein
MSSTLLRTDPISGRPQRGPLVQHRGICLERAGALAQPRNMGGEYWRLRHLLLLRS